MRIRQLMELKGNKCHYCGITVRLYGLSNCCKPDQATRDHAIPKARGGDDSIDNMVVSCRTCNCNKGSLTESEFNFVSGLGPGETLLSVSKDLRTLKKFNGLKWERVSLSPEGPSRDVEIDRGELESLEELTNTQAYALAQAADELKKAKEVVADLLTTMEVISVTRMLEPELTAARLMESVADTALARYRGENV